MMSNPKDILLVQADPDEVSLTMRCFEAHRLANRLVVSHDCSEAGRLLHGKNAHDFAFVLLDLALPKVGIVDIIGQIRADPRTRRLPVIVLTSSSAQEEILERYESGFVRKPVELYELAKAVTALGCFWAMVDETSTVLAPA